MAQVECAHCHVTFNVKPYRLARSPKLFCSVACRKLDGTTFPVPPSTKVERTCPVCDARFLRKPAELLPVNYCSIRCSVRANGNLRPCPKGERRSKATEFPAGAVPHNTLPLGAVTVRKRPNRGDVRAWVKVAEPNVWRPRALVAYEAAYGPVPSGMVIHHVDEDSLNDDPANLVALSRGDHAAIHSASKNKPIR